MESQFVSDSRVAMLSLELAIALNTCLILTGDLRACTFFIYFFKDLFYFYWKGGYTESRDREEDLPSDDSLSK